MESELLLYVDPAWKKGGLYTPLLFPFWGNPVEDSSLFTKEMFNAYPFDTSLYRITNNLQEAHMVLVPYRHVWLLRNNQALLDECVRTAQSAKLPLLIDGAGDIELPVGIPDAYVLRVGGYRFQSEAGRINIPFAADDLLERCMGGELQMRKKGTGKAVVGFAGWTHLSFGQKFRTVLKELPWRLQALWRSRYRAMTKGVLWRARAIRTLKASPLVTLNLKERRSFSGSAKTAEGDMRELRQDFVDTVLNCDYALDVRGDANNSTRLFEILSLGRIPVILDTERNFPFSDTVDYSSFALFVDFRDIQKLPQKIAEFHAQVTPQKFEAMQQAAREAFVRYFRTDVQMREIVRLLRASVPGLQSEHH